MKYLKIIRKKNKIYEIYTKNLVKGVSVYGEKLVNFNGIEYREWIPSRSKLSAAIFKGLNLQISENSTILYLGAATGTTVSHISDLVPKGIVFAIDFSPFVMYSLIMLAKQRKNIAPILADASKPEQYYDKVLASDFLFQDIAQPNQVEIFIKNTKLFLKRKGLAMISIKSRSIDISKKPSYIFKKVSIELNKNFREVKQYNLSPFERDHALFVCRNFLNY